MGQLSTLDELDLDALQIPEEICCNCGRPRDLSIVPTPLKKTRYMLLGGSELTITLGFPYCPDCAATASKHAIGAFGKLLISFVLFGALMLGVIFVPFNLAAILPGAMLPLTVFSIAVAPTLGYFHMRRPRPPRTSADQPVSLRGVKQLFAGDVVGLRLAFSNPKYKQRFDASNQPQISSGVLTTENVG